MRICVFNTITNLIEAVDVANLIPYAQAYPAYENLVSGALVTLFTDVDNVTKVKNASANTAGGGLPAVGFVINATNSGTIATVTFEGPNVVQSSGFSISDIGNTAYLSDVLPGNILRLPPTALGTSVQPVGFVTGVVSNQVTLSFVPAFPGSTSEDIQSATLNPSTLSLTRNLTIVKCHGGISVILPTPTAALIKYKLVLKRIDNNGPVLINGSIDGFSGTPVYTLQAQRSVVNLICDGSTWLITSAL